MSQPCLGNIYQSAYPGYGAYSGYANPYGTPGCGGGAGGGGITLPGGCRVVCPGPGGGTGPYPPYPGYPGYPGVPGYPGFPGYPGYPGGPGTYPPGYQCPPCEPGTCGADDCNCPKCPWLDTCAVYGGMYRSEIYEETLAAGTHGRVIMLDAPLPMQHILTSSGSITVQCSGTYEITFFGNFKFSADTHLTFYLKSNGTRLNDTVVEKDVTAEEYDSFERTVIVHLCSNSTLQAVVDNADATSGGSTGVLTIPAHGMHVQIVRIGSYRA